MSREVFHTAITDVPEPFQRRDERRFLSGFSFGNTRFDASTFSSVILLMKHIGALTKSYRAPRLARPIEEEHRTMARRSRSTVADDASADVEERLAQLENLVTNQQRQLEVQLVRIAQLQADLDEIRGAWVRIKPPPVDPALRKA